MTKVRRTAFSIAKYIILFIFRRSALISHISIYFARNIFINLFVDINKIILKYLSLIVKVVTEYI